MVPEKTPSAEHNQPNESSIGILDALGGKLFVAVDESVIPEGGGILSLRSDIVNVLDRSQQSINPHYVRERSFGAVIVTPPLGFDTDELVFVPGRNGVTCFSVVETPDGKTVSSDTSYSKKEERRLVLELPADTRIRTLLEMTVSSSLPPDAVPNNSDALEEVRAAHKYYEAVHTYIAHRPTEA